MQLTLFSKTSRECTSRRKLVSNIGAMCGFSSSGLNRPIALRSHVIFSAMLEGKQIGCYGKQWLPRGITFVSYANICTNSFFVSEQNDLYPLVKFALYLKNLCDRAFAFTFTSNALGESLFQLIHGLIDSVIHE